MRGTGNKYGSKRAKAEFQAKTMRSRGQTVRLKSKATGDEVRLLVILSDSKQGYLASDKLTKAKFDSNTGKPLAEGDWAWYNLNEWSEI